MLSAHCRRLHVMHACSVQMNEGDIDVRIMTMINTCGDW